MADRDFTIRKMDQGEVVIAVDWAAAEGWNPGLHDAETYYAADKDGFLIGLLGDEPIATISAVKYGGSFGFLGFYIVKPAYRGQGYGMRIWRAALEYLQGCNIALDGVVEHQDNYKKSGFRFACRNVRYQGAGDGLEFFDPSVCKLASLPLETVEAYLRPFFPADRYGFNQSWISQPDASALGCMKDESLSGCGVIRACRNGYKIGPLFADTPEQAEMLFGALTATVERNAPFYLDVPQLNPAAEALAERYNMETSFETARMYTGQAPDLPWSRTFGITSFEIG